MKSLASSSDIAVSVRGLSKAYTIAHNDERHVTLAEQMLHRLRNPFKRTETETFWALKDVEFDIKKGDVVGIIGRNGAGKSTLLKILSRITEPTAGEIRLYGRVGSLLEVGTGFHPELTGRENVLLNGAILGMSKAEIRKQFDAIVDFAGVEKFLDTPVKRYSSGMYVRLAFAVAAHLRTEILIVDEVLAVGDVQFQKKCLGKMQEISESDGRTVLFVSHNMTAVRQLTSSAVLLNAGQIAFQGKTQVAVDRYEVMGSARSNIYETAEMPRPNFEMSGGMRIIRLWFDQMMFESEVDIRFRLRVSAERVFRRFRVSLSMFRSDDSVIGSAFGEDTLSISEGQEQDYLVSIPRPRLAPGHYHMAVAVGQGSGIDGHKDFDIVTGVLRFEVMPPDGAGGTQASWSPGWGAIRFSPLECSWVSEAGRGITKNNQPVANI